MELEQERIKGGFIITPRCISESAIAHMSPVYREIWHWMLITANHKEQKSYGSIIKRGQLFTSYSEIMEALHWRVGYRKETYKKHDCENVMNWLTKEQMITKSKTTRGLLITVCKYDTYQNIANYVNDTENVNETTRERQPTDTINNKGNKEISKKVKKEKKGSDSERADAVGALSLSKFDLDRANLFVDTLEKNYNERRDHLGKSNKKKYPQAKLGFKNQKFLTLMHQAIKEIGTETIEKAWLVYTDKIVDGTLNPQKVLPYFLSRKDDYFDVIGSLVDIHGTDYEILK